MEVNEVGNGIIPKVKLPLKHSVFTFPVSFVTNLIRISISSRKKNCSGDKMENEMVWSCSAYGGDERSRQGFGGET
jgi:hypothetical protein